jgi:hypothetical protein
LGCFLLIGLVFGFLCRHASMLLLVTHVHAYTSGQQ